MKTPRPDPILCTSSRVIVFAAIVLLIGWNIGVATSITYDFLSPMEIEKSESRALFLFLGDSLTERGEGSEPDGWIMQLRTRYNRSIDVVSRGLSGYNSKWYIQHVLPRIEQDLEVLPTPTLITVWLGANDAALVEGDAAHQHVPVEEYKANLLTIIERLRAKTPRTNFVLITPPAVLDNFRQSMHDGVLDRSNEQAGVYAAACVEQAAIANVPVLDLHSHFNSMSETDRNESLIDGLHFTSAGNTEVKELLLATISSEFPALASEIEVSSYPEWRVLAYLEQKNE